MYKKQNVITPIKNDNEKGSSSYGSVKKCRPYELFNFSFWTMSLCTSHLKPLHPPPRRAWAGHSLFIQVKTSKVSGHRGQQWVVLSHMHTGTILSNFIRQQWIKRKYTRAILSIFPFENNELRVNNIIKNMTTFEDFHLQQPCLVHGDKKLYQAFSKHFRNAGPLRTTCFTCIKILRSGTSKTKELVTVQPDFPLFWKSHCVICAPVPVLFISCHVTRSCKELIQWAVNKWPCIL